MNGTSRPCFRPSSAISSSSVESTAASNQESSPIVRAAWAIKDSPPTFCMFFRGTPLLLPRAGTTARTVRLFQATLFPTLRAVVQAYLLCENVPAIGEGGEQLRIPRDDANLVIVAL